MREYDNKILILENSDLTKKYGDPNTLLHRDFTVEAQQKLVNYEIVLYIGHDGTTRIIKNKFGKKKDDHNYAWLIEQYETLNEMKLDLIDERNNIVKYHNKLVVAYETQSDIIETLQQQIETLTERYIEDEKFIESLKGKFSPFLTTKINKFINKLLEKY